MGWTLTDDVKRFRSQAGAFLESDPVANTVALTVTEAMLAQGSGIYDFARFGWWTDGGTIEGTFLWTGGYPPLLSAMPERAARALAVALAGGGAAVPGVNAAPAAAEAFAAATGAASRVAVRLRLHRLARLDLPTPAPEGAPRVASGTDRALVLDWFAAFNRDAGEHGAVNPAVIDGSIADGCIALWETGGLPVAMAGRTPVVADTARVAPVYTPAEHRRRGYGTAITAAVTRAALDAGAAEVVLFTDLSNPTSNSVYHRLGYRPVEDRVILSFT